jgi:hypothetical protein
MSQRFLIWKRKLGQKTRRNINLSTNCVTMQRPVTMYFTEQCRSFQFLCYLLLLWEDFRRNQFHRNHHCQFMRCVSCRVAVDSRSWFCVRFGLCFINSWNLSVFCRHGELFFLCSDILYCRFSNNMTRDVEHSGKGFSMGEVLFTGWAKQAKWNLRAVTQ